MYKFMGILVLYSVCAMVAAYTDLDDTLDIDGMVKDKARLKTYVDCDLDRSPCTPQMEGYKNHLREAISDGCAECNDTERHLLKVFIQGLRNNVPKADFEEFKTKFDPNGHIDTTFSDLAKF